MKIQSKTVHTNNITIITNRTHNHFIKKKIVRGMSNHLTRIRATSRASTTLTLKEAELSCKIGSTVNSKELLITLGNTTIQLGYHNQDIHKIKPWLGLGARTTQSKIGLVH